MFPDSLEITAAIIVAARYREEWRYVYDRLQQGETFLSPESLRSDRTVGAS